MGRKIGYAYLIISLCSTMRFNSFTTREPTHTDGRVDEQEGRRGENDWVVDVQMYYALSLRMSESFL